MGAYAREPENISKSCKSRGDNLRVHFKVNITKKFRWSIKIKHFYIFFRTPARRHLLLNVWHFVALNASWRTLLSIKSVFHSVATTAVSAELLKPVNGEHPSVVGQRSPPISSSNCWRTLKPMLITKAWTSTDWSLITFRWDCLLCKWKISFWSMCELFFRSIALHACVVAHIVPMVASIPTCLRHATLSWLWLKRRKSYHRSQPRKKPLRRSNPKRSFKNKRRRWCATSKPMPILVNWSNFCVF